MSAVLERAAERIEAFQARTLDAVRLARVASLAVRLDAPLLRTLRFTLVPDADVGAEGDLWFSPLVESCGTSSAVLDQHVVALLRETLLTEPGLLARAAHITRMIHASMPPLLRLEEDVTIAALLQGEAAAAAIDTAFQPVMRSLVGNDDRGREVARWMLRAAPRFPPIVWRAPTAYAVLARSSILLDGRRALAELPRNDVRLEEIAWALPVVESDERIDVDVWLTSDSLRFVLARGRSTIQIPAAAPPLVEVVWNEPDGTLASVLAEATPGQAVPLGGPVERLSIRTIAGDVYSVERATAAAPPREEPRQAWRPDRARVLDLGDADDACVLVESASGVRATGFYIDPQTVATAAKPFERERDLTISVSALRRRARVVDGRSDDEVLILAVDGPEAYSEPPEVVDRDLSDFPTVRIVAALDDRLLPLEARVTRGRTGTSELEVGDRRLPVEFFGAPVIVDDTVIGIVTGLSPSLQDTTLLHVASGVRLRRAMEARGEQPVTTPPVTPADAPTARRRIYLAYSRQDRDIVRSLSRLLRSSTDAVWLDDQDIEPGQPWIKAIEQQVLSADQVLVLVSKASIASELVTGEIDLALRYDKPIVPVLLDRNIRLPPSLARFQALDLSHLTRGATVSRSAIEVILRFLALDSSTEGETRSRPPGPQGRDVGDEQPRSSMTGSAPWTAITESARRIWKRLTSRPEAPSEESQETPRRPRGRDDIPR
jgi:hypothetical protein